MPADLTLMPGGEDGFDVGEVLVERGAADTGFLGYLRHGHSPQTTFGHELCRCLQRGLLHRPTMSFDRLVPQLRHAAILHDDWMRTVRLDKDSVSR